MKNLSLIFLLFLAPLSQAGAMSTPTPTPPILMANQVSGYTQMENAFQYHCQLSAEGILQGLRLEHLQPNGQWQTITPFQSKVETAELNHLEELISQAEAGPFVEGPNSCDAGTLVIIGQVPGHFIPYPLIAAPDCGQATLNESPVAKELIQWVAKNCKLIY